MTKSEFFVVMCSGFASVAGSVMGAFIEMGKLLGFSTTMTKMN